MNLFGKEIKLAIFDLDGTLINSTHIWKKIDEIFFSRRNMKVPKEYENEISHRDLRDAAEFTKSKYFPNEKIDDIINEWENEAFDQYDTSVTLKNNSLELLKLLKNNNVLIALATVNNFTVSKKCLKRLGVLNYFDFIVDSNNFHKGKTSADLYMAINNYFHIKPKNTLVFEDLPVPITTAREAGFNVIGVYDPISTSLDEITIKTNSVLFINDFKDIIDLINKENKI